MFKVLENLRAGRKTIAMAQGVLERASKMDLRGDRAARARKSLGVVQMQLETTRIALENHERILAEFSVVRRTILRRHLIPITRNQIQVCFMPTLFLRNRIKRMVAAMSAQEQAFRALLARYR